MVNQSKSISLSESYRVGDDSSKTRKSISGHGTPRAQLIAGELLDVGGANYGLFRIDVFLPERKPYN